jgi:predicted enzyme related to lactoylglutathione lyase
VCTFGVESVDAYVQKAVAAGGKLALPKKAIPGLAWLAYGTDIEGNIFGVFEEDTDAK